MRCNFDLVDIIRTRLIIMPKCNAYDLLLTKVEEMDMRWDRAYVKADYVHLP